MILTGGVFYGHSTSGGNGSLMSIAAYTRASWATVISAAQEVDRERHGERQQSSVNNTRQVKDMSLSEMHKKFADEYLIDSDGKGAYIRAGYKARGNAAEVNASRLLRNAKIKAYIEERQKDREKRTEITQDRILKEYARLGFFDPRKLFNDDGSPKPIQELDDDTAAAIAGLDVLEQWEGSGNDRKFIGLVKKYRIVDKRGALDSMARTQGMFTDKVEHSGQLVIIKGESNLED